MILNWQMISLCLQHCYRYTKVCPMNAQQSLRWGAKITRLEWCAQWPRHCTQIFFYPTLNTCVNICIFRSMRACTLVAPICGLNILPVKESTGCSWLPNAIPGTGTRLQMIHNRYIKDDKALIETIFWHKGNKIAALNKNQIKNLQHR